jgi:small ubiquitin-related modifier
VEKRTTGLKEITGAPLDLIDASMPAVVSGRGSAELLETDTCAGAANRAALAAAAGTAEEEPSSIKARSEACGDPSLVQGKEPANGRIRAYKAAMQMEPMAEWSRAPDMPFGPKDPDEVSKQGDEAKPKTMQLKVAWPNGMQEVLECKPDSKLEKLMLASCERRGVAMKDVRFLFDGDRIGVNDTPNKLGMEDGDSIDAFMRPLYGVNYEASNPNSWGMVTDPELFEAARDDLLEAALVAQMDVASSELEDSAEATRSRMASPTAELEDSAEAATRLATHEREQGIRRMHEGDYRAALDHFVTALKCFSKLQGRSRAAPDANTYSLAQAACVFYGVDVAQRLLPDVLCKKARVLCLLGAHEDALEATEDAAALHPRLLKPSCVAAIAYRGLHRQADAQRMLDKCERLWQEAMAVRSQAALLTAFQRYIARARALSCVRVHL